MTHYYSSELPILDLRESGYFAYTAYPANTTPVRQSVPCRKHELKPGEFRDRDESAVCRTWPESSYHATPIPPYERADFAMLFKRGYWMPRICFALPRLSTDAACLPALCCSSPVLRSSMTLALSASLNCADCQGCIDIRHMLRATPGERRACETEMPTAAVIRSLYASLNNPPCCRRGHAGPDRASVDVDLGRIAIRD